MTRWEYTILDVGVAGFWLGPDLDGDALTTKLNEPGADGWEAVTVAPMTVGHGSTKTLVIVLKRPLATRS